MKKIFALITLFLSVISAIAQGNGLTGYATYYDLGQQGTTGGAGGQVVHVSTRADFEKYIQGSTPYIIIVDEDIIGRGVDDMKDAIMVGSNKTIIGAGKGKHIKGICLDIHRQRNLIFRNLYISKGNNDAITMLGCNHVWVDHCDLSDSYDGLLDFTVGSDYMSCTWTKLHDHDKVSITNSGTGHYEDYGKEHVSFAHCWFANNVQRNPRIGYGRMLIYNCYWTDISSYCIGFHSQAEVLSENNYFSKTALNPFRNQYMEELPYCGYLTDHGSYFANGDPGRSHAHPFTDIHYTPKTFFNWDFDITPALSVPEDITAGVGPQEGIEHEPILCPGNGAIDVPVTQRLSWGNMDGVTQTKVVMGTSRSSMKAVDVNSLTLRPATTYYWQVTTTVNGKEYPSPVYQFTTAAAQASKPYPADGSNDAWILSPKMQSRYCEGMNLKWRQAADAKEYVVYLSDNKKTLEKNCLGKTRTDGSDRINGSELYIPAGILKVGKTYYWRVDAINANGKTVKGKVWSFTTPDKHWNVGRNEIEERHLSGLAFAVNNDGFSNGRGVRGDTGPGAVLATFNGKKGLYTLKTGHIAQRAGTMTAIKVYGSAAPMSKASLENGKFVDEWYTATGNSLTEHITRQPVELSPGDVISIEFIARGSGYGLLDYLTIEPSDGKPLAAIQPAKAPHNPVFSRGRDYEYLNFDGIEFVDSLGTIGEKGARQIRDGYSSWISRNESGYTLFLKNTAKVETYYGGRYDGSTTTTKYNPDELITINIPLVDNNGARVQGVGLYKTLPADTVFCSPVKSEGLDYMFLNTSDVVMRDVEGRRGAAGRYQIRSEYEQWVKADANSGDVKVVANRKAFINPLTDEPNATPWRGKDGSSNSYVVGAGMKMNYYLENASRIKVYFTGSSGQPSNMLAIDVKDLTTGKVTTVISSDCPGKEKSSAAVETQIPTSGRVIVTVRSEAGDCAVYAVKLY